VKSLFRSAGLSPVYELPPQVGVLPHGDRSIVVNPETGGWCVAGRDEVAALFHPRACPRHLAEEAYRCGIVRRNGGYATPPRPAAAGGVMRLFEFNLTPGCNLACVYCCNDGRPDRLRLRAGPEVAVAFVERALEYARTQELPGLVVEFTGGEPFLNWPAMRLTMEEMTRRAPPGLEVEWLIQTNLTAVTAEQLQFLRPFRPRIGISWDGPPEIQDAQRRFADGRGSYAAVRRNLQLAREAGFDIRAAYCVVTAATVARLPELARFFLEQGMLALVFEPTRASGRGGEAPALLPDPELFAHRLWETLTTVFIPYYQRTGTMPVERHTMLTLAQLLEPARRYMCYQAPCGGARLISVTMADGRVYPCNELPWPEGFCLGNVFEHSFADMADSEAARRLRERVPERIEGCRECLYRGWCHSRCAQGALVRHGRLLAPSLYCEFARALFDTFLRALVDRRCDPGLARLVAREAACRA